MAQGGTTRRSLLSFKERGLSVAIDDFGTGYSSLAYLHTLPVTTVKVDRSFVERLGSAQDSTPVVRAIVEMSHALGLHVVAEGVSSEGLRSRVVELGCDLSQGFLWAKPMPAAEFAAWWRLALERALVGTP
jgi:EAL domain-containing protein (putative c-di-GMP-specific phosphodiesterase class I)